MFKRLSCFFYVLFILISTLTYANELSERSAVKEIVGNKLYLKPTTVHIANNGIFLNIQGALIRVNHLEVDDKGVYIDALKAGAGDIFMGECPVCHDITICGVCTNGACPTKHWD
ncbi:putative secreted protein (plasmid) [Candidatus Protochlamydia naegleriophila]|uniref:Putative secreted protein n=1 Tax=Candidatus Protochlamydia naegleriophila TaxID=389348 RepID=A0A0U5JF40_9BACT|nr:hypothetical protein [Candidatus Protochlamydia naegleriophila]CUI18126.1 putative secreted protein [Candidatus Protochlamydia naegleriophila]